MPLQVGETAPSFSLVHRIGQDPVTLEGLLAEGPVVVFFYPLAFSPVCTDEVCTVEAAWSHADAPVPARAVGISVDSPFVNARFAEATGATFPLLSDFNRDVATAWGVRNDDFFGMRGVANRSAFVIDPAGVVRYAWMSEDPAVLPDLDEIRATLDHVRGAAVQR